MRKIAFLFPGQGSQKVGMGKDLVDSYPAAKCIFDEAKKILGFNVQRLCIEGPEEELNRTVNLQPALVVVNWILTKLLKEKGVSFQAAAGHSLGEYSALLATGVIGFPTALKIVKQRAYLMEQAGKNKKGSMAAVIGIETAKVIDICRQIREVEVVNFNCPGQVVISGSEGNVLGAVKKLKNQGAKKVVLLPVSGAFHSFLMTDAAKKFSIFLDRLSFSDPICPIVSNATGEYAISSEQVKENLKLQMDHPVLWEKSMRLLVNDGFNTFVEVGPGKVLQGLLKRIDRKVAVFGVESMESANQLIDLLS